jgi:molybdopterin converting factor subunit 1
MAIRVLFFATLAEVTGVRETTIEAGEFPDVKSVFTKFARDFPALESHRQSAIAARNSEFARPETSVQDGDEIAFFPPVSGG